MASERPCDKFVGVDLTGSDELGVSQHLIAGLQAFEASGSESFLDRLSRAHGRSCRSRGSCGHVPRLPEALCEVMVTTLAM